MKKSFIAMFTLLLLMAAIGTASAKTTTSNSSLASAIKLYKAKNYSQSYVVLKDVVKKDPSNAVAYYYLAMASAQIGNKNEAIENYQKVLSLSPNSQLEYYAKKGKVCLEDEEKCNEADTEESKLDHFVRGKFGSGFSNEARGSYEKQKIENLMREMNRNDSITPKKFKDYKDFSSQAEPSNEEIVAAVKTLQQAGLVNMLSTNSYRSDLSMLTSNADNSINEYEMLNLMLGKKQDNNIDARLIQSLLTNQMSTSF